MNTNDPTSVSAPWPPPSVLPRQRGSRDRWWIWIVAGAVGFITITVGSALAAKDDGPSQRMSLTEAVCQMLNDGTDPETAYGTAKILASQYPLTYGEDESVAARVAVQHAQAQGCG